MKTPFIGFVLLGCLFSFSLQAQSLLPTNTLPGSEWKSHEEEDIGWEFSDLFDQSDLFEEGSFFLGTNYQFWSTIGDRTDKTRGLVPPVQLLSEIRLFYNLGLRFNGSINFWEEEKVLVESFSEQFTETFNYRYWTAGGGLAWHFTLNDIFDPYLGFDINFRSGRGFCECQDLSGTKVSFDVFIGSRFFISDQFFVLAEFGSTGVGNVSLGLGYKFY